MKSLVRQYVAFRAGSQKVPRPRAPSTAEPFEKKVSEEEMKMLLDPRGFMSEEEKAREETNQPPAQQQQPTETTTAYG